MSSQEIWKSVIRANDDAEFVVDINKCLWADTCAYFNCPELCEVNCPELCEVFCLSDHIVFENIKGLAFRRSQTIGMGGNKCDFSFRFKKMNR